LSSRVSETIPSGIRSIQQDPILHSNGNSNKDIVLGLGLARDIELLNAERQAPDDALERPEDAVKAWIEELFEFAEGLDDGAAKVIDKRRKLGGL
jgi:hypothetical protein